MEKGYYSEKIDETTGNIIGEGKLEIIHNYDGSTSSETFIYDNINKFSSPLNVKEGAKLNITGGDTDTLTVGSDWQLSSSVNLNNDYQLLAAAGIVANGGETYGDITISGGNIVSSPTILNYSSNNEYFNYGAAIGVSYDNSKPKKIQINGGSVYATSNSRGAAIGGSNGENVELIEITGGYVDAKHTDSCSNRNWWWW